MTEPFVSSRFPLVERPVAYPYYDLILQDTRGPVFDLNVDMDSYDGAVYVLPEHIIEMGRTLGMATIEEVAEMKARIKKLESQIDKLPTAQEELKIGIDNLVADFYSNLVTVDYARSVLFPVDPEPAKDDREPETSERKADGPLIL